MLESSTGDANEAYPFESIIDPDDAASVAIRCGGMYRSNNPGANTLSTGIMIATAASLPGVYEADSLTDNPSVLAHTSYTFDEGTHFIYMVADGAEGIGDLTGAGTWQVVAKSGDAYPTEITDGTWQSDSFIPLSYVVVDAEGAITIIPQYTGGSGFLNSINTDSDDPMIDAGDRIKSIEFNDDGDLQVFGIDGAAHGESLYADVSGAAGKVDGAWRWSNTYDTPQLASGTTLNLLASPTVVTSVIRFHQHDYVVTDGASNITEKANIDIDIWGMCDEWWLDSIKVMNHTDLADMPDAGNADHDGRYWIKGDNLAECFGESIGFLSGTVGTPKIRIDLEGSVIYDGEAIPKASVDAGGRTLLFTDGASTVYDWGNLQFSGSHTIEGDFIPSADNAWNLGTGGAAWGKVRSHAYYDGAGNAGITSPANDISAGLVIGDAGLPGGTNFKAEVTGIVQDILGGMGY